MSGLRKSIRDDVLNWFATGEVGLSSRSLACAIAGIAEEDPRGHYPRDPGDLRRCLLMLDRVAGSRGRLSDAKRRLDPRWGPLLDAWGEVEALFVAEVGDYRNCSGKLAPLTYKLMKELEAESSREDGEK